MITRKIAIAGGELGRPPVAFDAFTGAEVWRGRHIIDETQMMVETSAGNILLVDDKNRFITVSKDGVILQEGYFGVGAAFNAVLHLALLARFPDAVFSEWAEFRVGVLQVRDIFMPNSNDKLYTFKVGADRYFTRFYDATFGYNRILNQTEPSPIGWITPIGCLFTFNAETNTYIDLVLLFDPDGEAGFGAYFNLLNVIGGAAYFSYRKASTNSQYLVKLVISTGVITFKPINGADFQLSSVNRTLPYLSNWGVPKTFLQAASGLFKIPDIEALFNRDTDYIFADATDFNTELAAGNFIAEFNPPLPDLTALGSFVINEGSFVEVCNRAGNDASSLDGNLIYFSTLNNNNNLWTIFVYNKDTEAFSLFDGGHVYNKLQISNEEGIDSDDLRLGRFFRNGDYLYGPVDYGYGKLNIATGEFTQLRTGGDDDEDFTRSMWYVDWPVYVLDAAVTSPGTGNSLTVHVYDQNSGRRLKTREITGTQHIPCFTQDTKFLVCESPDGTNNFQIAAHLAPVEVTSEILNSDFNFIGTSLDSNDFAF